MSVVVLRVMTSGRIVTPQGWRDGYEVVVVCDGQPQTDGVARTHADAWAEVQRVLLARQAVGDEVTLG